MGMAMALRKAFPTRRCRRAPRASLVVIGRAEDRGPRLRKSNLSLDRQSIVDISDLRRESLLFVDGPFDFPMVIDGPREVENLDYVIEQLRRALERLSSNEAWCYASSKDARTNHLRRASSAASTFSRSSRRWDSSAKLSPPVR